MATLVLSAVGTAIGGPVGGAIGALIGQQVDQIIFAPKARHGPRLGELSVQTSSYGTMIPKLFGTMRVAGTVIWSTDLKEERTSRGGGKGKPKTVEYSYSASFAVALSGRPVRSVRRIWADGKLLRGAAGDFKSRTKFRLYPGDEDQLADPLIVSAEGAGQAPAFRGTAYAMFEDMELADFGNRIPSLTFEIDADAGPVAIGRIAEVLSAGEVTQGATPSLAGYAASGDSVRSAIEALGDVVPMSMADTGTSLRIAAGASEPVAIAKADESGPGEEIRRAAGTVAGEVSIAYYDVARDHQTGLQRAVRGASPRSDRRALPAALRADEAKALAEFRLAALWEGRATAKLRLGWRRSGVRPGMHARIEGKPGLWKVRRWTLGAMWVDVELLRVPIGPIPALTGTNPGRPIGYPDFLPGPTTLRLYDLPLGFGTSERPVLYSLAAGAGAGWRRAELAASFDGGASWDDAGGTAAPAVIGWARTALPAGESALFDRVASVVVELLNEGMWLEARSDAAMAAGANLALIGRELVQFGKVEPLGSRRFRLSRFLRGRRGTEWAADTHEEGEDFALIESASAVALEAPLSAVGGEARLMGSSIGDDGAEALAKVPISGEALRPPSPVHLAVKTEPNGDMLIRWVRRSRAGWEWTSGSGTPLGEEREAYRLTIAGDGYVRTAQTAEPFYLYTAAQRAQDGHAGSLLISVVQIGTLAASRPAVLSLV